MQNVLELDNTQYKENASTQIRTPAVIAAEINVIKVQTCTVVAHSTFEIGKRLCEAKEQIDHGEWTAWLKDNVAYSEITAQRLMKAYREFSGEAQELEEGAPNVFEGLNFSQIVALFPLPREHRAEFVKQNALEDKSAREVRELVEREKQAIEEAKKAKESAALAEAAVKEAHQARTLAEQELSAARTDKSKMTAELNELKSKNAKLVDDMGKLNVKMNKLKVPEEKEVPPSEETLAKIREDLAREYAVKADPDVQGITFNLGDLSERVQKIDEQLTRIKERDPDMEKALREKLSGALSQIFANIEWTPWKDEAAPA